MKNRITLKHVATQAGVSNQLVSAVFSGRASSVRYTEATRQKVLQAAGELGFRPSILAQSFRGNRSFLIGVLNRVDHGWMSDRMLRGIQDVLVGAELTPLLLTYQRDEGEERNMNEFSRRQVDGLIVNVGAARHDCYERMKEAGFPVVQLIDNSLAKFGIPNVMSDLVGTGATATRHLQELGHRRIAHLTHARYLLNRDAHELYLGYERAMREAGLQPQVFTHSLDQYRLGEPSSFYDCAVEAMEAVMAEPRPSAVLCYECFGAFRLIESATACGLAVPGELAVVGVNDLDICKIAKPMLSTMRVGAYEIGRAAAEEMVRMLGGESGCDRLIQTTLVARGSSVPGWVPPSPEKLPAPPEPPAARTNSKHSKLLAPR
ncbi:MAG: LacI family DNA-binding transcriptional regulator [Verrucomicrobia bacterium]|nr:LacI family DNA-binding transcriptional regulator [Verrucomicrobiota bacterium]